MSSLHCDESISELISSFRLVNDCTVDIPERYQALVQSEIVYAAEDYASAPGTPFSTSWRRRIAEWLFQVADAYHLSRETVNISMSFLDRYLSKTTVNKKYFQLASMTAFFLAAKMQENRPMKMSNLIGLSRGVFKLQDLKTMEKVMLRQLKWHINPPTPGSFVRLFLHYLEVNNDAVLRNTLEIAEWNTELSTVEYYFIRFKPKTIAMASILNAFEKSPNPPSTEAVKKFLDSITKELKFDFESASLSKCRTALMKMYSASNIEEDMKNDAEVEMANNKLGSPKPNQNLRVVSPTAVEEVKTVEKAVAKAANAKKNADEDEDEDLDEELAGINKGIIEVGVTTQRAITVSRSTGSLLDKYGTRGNEMSEAAKLALKECLESSIVPVNNNSNYSNSNGSININIADNMSNFKVTARSRPSSSMSNTGPALRPPSRAESMVALSTRGLERRKSFDNISTLRQVKMAKGGDGSPIMNRERRESCPSCPPGVEGGLGPDAARVGAESWRGIGESGKKRPRDGMQAWEGVGKNGEETGGHGGGAVSIEGLCRSKRANSSNC